MRAFLSKKNQQPCHKCGHQHSIESSLPIVFFLYLTQPSLTSLHTAQTSFPLQMFPAYESE